MAHLLQILALVSVVSLSFPPGANAHVEMSWPYPFRSKFDPAMTDPDYDNTLPLSQNGTNYPCRGYQNLASSQVSKVTYTPGKTYNITLAGTATHLGGSCQISLSYDNSQSFKVVKSMIGGCPLKDSWNFTVPSNAPASQDVTLAWTWFNLVGNREMYMSCARVSIARQSVQRYQRRQSKRQSSLGSLPDIFACNIGNGCRTVERREVVFPNPGPDIERNTDAATLEPGPGFTLTSEPSDNAFSTVSTNTTTTITQSSYPNTTLSIYTESTGSGVSSTMYFNSTSVLIVTSRYSSTTSLFTSTSTSSTTSTRITARPAFFYLISSTDVTSISTASSTTTVLTPSTNSQANTTAFGFFPNTTTTLSVPTAALPVNTTTAATSTSAPFANLTTTETNNTVPFAGQTTTENNITTTATDSTVSFANPTVTSSDDSALTIATTTRSLSISSTTSTSSVSTSSILTRTAQISLSPIAVSSSTSDSTLTITLITTLVTLPLPTTSPISTATIVPASCTPGSFTCNTPTTFSQCVPNEAGSGTYVFMGFVAPGMQCVEGSIIRQNAGSCTPDGSLQCNGETAFYICDQGGLINMGSVAPGTVCRNGAIGFQEFD